MKLPIAEGQSRRLGSIGIMLCRSYSPECAPTNSPLVRRWGLGGRVGRRRRGRGWRGATRPTRRRSRLAGGSFQNHFSVSSSSSFLSRLITRTESNRDVIPPFTESKTGLFNISCDSRHVGRSPWHNDTFRLRKLRLNFAYHTPIAFVENVL